MPHAQVPHLVDLRIRGHLEVLLEEANPWDHVSGTQYRCEKRSRWSPLYRLHLPLYCQVLYCQVRLEPFPTRSQERESGHLIGYRSSSR